LRFIKIGLSFIEFILDFVFDAFVLAYTVFVLFPRIQLILQQSTNANDFWAIVGADINMYPEFYTPIFVIVGLWVVYKGWKMYKTNKKDQLTEGHFIAIEKAIIELTNEIRADRDERKREREQKGSL
jgi:hypothetical protein